MAECKIIKNLFSMYFAGELSPDESDRVKQHFVTCPSCTGEYKNLTILAQTLPLLEEDCRQSIQETDWSSVKHTIKSRVIHHKPAARRSGSSVFTFRPIWIPAATAVFLLGLTFGYIILKFQFNLKSTDLHSPSVPSIHQIESAFKKSNISTYLKQSQLILADLLKSKTSQEIAELQKTPYYKKALGLLRENRFFSLHTEEPDLIGAIWITKKIEWLLIEIISKGDKMTIEELLHLQMIIERERLLLKIRLIEKELSDYYPGGAFDGEVPHEM